MLDSLPLWIHILAATVWVGPQFLMFVAVVPSLRALPDATARYHLLRAFTPRFGWLGFGALVVLVLTGIDNINRYAPPDPFEIRYGYILVTKVSMVAVIFVVTACHTFYVGPALLRLQKQALDDPGTPPAGLAYMRALSMAFSVLTLVLSVLVLLAATTLRTAFGSHIV